MEDCGSDAEEEGGSDAEEEGGSDAEEDCGSDAEEECGSDAEEECGSDAEEGCDLDDPDYDSDGDVSWSNSGIFYMPVRAGGSDGEHLVLHVCSCTIPGDQSSQGNLGPYHLLNGMTVV